MHRKQLGAIFIDFENLAIALTNQYGLPRAEAETKTVDIIAKILRYMERKFDINLVIRQAFANWPNYPSAVTELYAMGIRTQNVKAAPQKNSADIELSLSLQETMLTRDVDILIVAAGDRDYIPIAMRIREAGRQVKFISFKKCFSGDLKDLVGQTNYLYVDTNGEITSEDEDREGVAGERGPRMREHRQSERPPREFATNPDVSPSDPLTPNEYKALDAAIGAFQEFGPRYGSVKLSGFLVDKLASALPELNHLQRKEVFNTLVAKDILQVRSETDPWGNFFYVFLLNRNRPEVAQRVTLLEKTGQEVAKKAEEDKTREAQVEKSETAPVLWTVKEDAVEKTATSPGDATPPADSPNVGV
ncbi:MAG: NYN domain-containing protein [Deltaproteobacteria bacterium]|nr:NYN domain-containing protein [Deltaproteobacteria bacterium]